jgi:hypothetical protein
MVFILLTWVHSLTREQLNAVAMIPLRHRKRKRIKGHYRRKIIFEFDEELYHKRNLVETAFSVLKRIYGEEVKARKYWNQVIVKDLWFVTYEF